MTATSAAPVGTQLRHWRMRRRLSQLELALAEAAGKRPLPRAVLPQIRLHSPKITRPLTTEWFARRVDERFQRCVAKAR